MDKQVASWKWLKETLLNGKTVSNYVTDSSPSYEESVTYKDLKNNFAVSGKVDDFSNKTPGTVTGTITRGDYTMNFSVTDSNNSNSLSAYGTHTGFQDSISRSQIKAAGLNRGNVF